MRKVLLTFCNAPLLNLPACAHVSVLPDDALAAHAASLGLTLDDKTRLPEQYAGGAFVGQHGAWNRKPHSGYKFIFAPFVGGNAAGPPPDILTGFLSPDAAAYSRLVGGTVGQVGAWLVADDVGNLV